MQDFFVEEKTIILKVKQLHMLSTNAFIRSKKLFMLKVLKVASMYNEHFFNSEASDKLKEALDVIIPSVFNASLKPLTKVHNMHRIPNLESNSKSLKST